MENRRNRRGIEEQEGKKEEHEQVMEETGEKTENKTETSSSGDGEMGVARRQSQTPGK